MDVKWDLRFLYLAEHIASWSKDPKTQLGSVIVDDRRRVLGVGYNGFPRGVDDRPERYNDHETKYDFVVHAEVNAISNCILRPEGATLYLSKLFPCRDCAKAIIQSGIRRVVTYHPDEEHKYLGYDVSMTMFNEAGVKYDFKSET